MRAFRLLVLLMGLGAGACSLLLEDSGFTGGQAPEDAGDSGEPGPPALDAAPEASADADAGRCDATFCDDFDEGPLGARWTSSSIVGAALDLDTVGPRSAPHSLRASALDQTIDEPLAILVHDLGKAKGVRCAVDIDNRARPSAQGDFVDFLVLTASSPDAKASELRFEINPSSWSVRQDLVYLDGGCACPSKNETIWAGETNRWVHLEVDTDFSTVQVLVDGVARLSTSFPPVTPSEITVQIGIQGYNGATAVVRFDDLACTVR